MSREVGNAESYRTQHSVVTLQQSSRRVQGICVVAQASNSEDQALQLQKFAATPIFKYWIQGARIPDRHCPYNAVDLCCLQDDKTAQAC